MEFINIFLTKPFSFLSLSLSYFLPPATKQNNKTTQVNVMTAAGGRGFSEGTIVQIVGSAEANNSVKEWKHSEWGQGDYDAEGYARLCDMWNGNFTHLVKPTASA